MPTTKKTTSAKTKTDTKKPSAKRAASGTASAAKSTVEKLGKALATTASFAAEVAHDTGERIREIVGSKAAAADPTPRATELLVEQHREVEKLFDAIEESKKPASASLRMLADKLSAHMAIEEHLFYPAVRKLERDIILEGIEEHAMGRFSLERLLGTGAGDETFKARFKALKELMTNHHGEEERDLFPKARKAFDDAALRKLGASMKTMFEADVKRGHEAVLATFDDAPKKPVRAKTPSTAKAPKKATKAKRHAKA